MSLAILTAALLYQSSDLKLIWSDEFDKPGAPNLENWRPEIGFTRNRELQWYQLDNATVKDGFLTIEAREERRKNPNYSPTAGQDWKKNREFIELTSSSLVSKQMWKFGRFEMRAKIDTRPGLWPAFWTWGEAREWPSGGEIDIMEYYRGKILANTAWGTSRRYTAKWDSSATPIEDLAKKDGLKSAEEWAEKFHTWRLDWDEKWIRIYVDGHLLNETDLSQTINESADKANPFHEPQRIIVNLAVGGDNGGDHTGTKFPAKYVIDWVRVYQKK